jgi:hypothetical protein
MTNPVIHALVLIAAVIIPGGLIVYLAWWGCKAKKQHAQRLPTPTEAREAFFSKYPPLSLRAQNKRQKLDKLKLWKRSNKNAE